MSLRSCSVLQPALLAVGLGLGSSCASSSSSSTDDLDALVFDRIQPAFFADLAAGLQVAGVTLDDLRYVPDDDYVEDDEEAGRLSLYVQSTERASTSDLARTYVLLEGVRGGDIEDLRLDFEYRYLEGGVRSGDGHCTYVYAKPYWGEVRGVEARARKLGFELGEAVAFSRFDGVLHRTTRENWYGILGASEAGTGTDLVAVALLFEPKELYGPYRVALEALPQRIRDSRDDDRHEQWQKTLNASAALGVPAAQAIVARMEAEARVRLEPALAALAETPEDVALETQLGRIADLGLIAHGAAEEGLRIPPDVVDALARHFAAVRRRFQDGAAAAQRDNDPVTRRRLDFLERCFARHDPFATRESRTAPGRAELDVLLRLVSMGAWIEGEGGRFSADRALDERLEALRSARQTAVDYVHPDALSKELLDGFVAELRSGLAEERAAIARAAEAKGLVATACGNFLLAHGIETDGLSATGETFIAAHRRLAETAPASWLDEARRVGLELAARYVPFAEISVDPRDMLAGAYDAGKLLERLAFTKYQRLGLGTGGKQDQLAFAEAVGARAWLVYTHDPVVTSIECRTSTFNASKVLESRREVPNDAEYTAWARVEAEILARAEAKHAEYREQLRMASRDPYMETTQHLVITNYSTTLVTGQRETTASMIERIAAKNLAQQAFEEHCAAIEECNRWWEQRPSRTAIEISRRVVEYPVEVQHWTIEVKRPVELIDGNETHRYEGETSLSVETQRIQPDPAIGVERVDTFQTEAAMREYAVAQDPTEANFCLFALKRELEARIAEPPALPADASDEECARERLWLRYFFTNELFDDLDHERGCSDPEIGGLAWAFRW